VNVRTPIAEARVGLVHVVLPGDIDDPAAPSGGNHYDRRVCTGLAASGWSVRELPVTGTWPRPAAAQRAKLAGVLAGVPDGGVVLLDGLVACGVPDIVVPAADRLRVAVLVHLPLADETGLGPEEATELAARERATLHAAAAVVATSGWAARRLIDLHALPAGRVHVAVPGVRTGPAVAAMAGGTRLTCVAAVTPRKGHDVLIEALAAVADLPWTCVCVGAVDRARGFVDRLNRSIEAHRLADRVRFTGPRTGDDLAETWAGTDLMVLASRAETYGMVVTEALAHAIPVLTTAVGGVPEALGRAPGGRRPGLLVPAADPVALGGALRRWLTEPDLRHALRRAAGARRDALPGWTATAATVAEVLAATVADKPATTAGTGASARETGARIRAKDATVRKDGAIVATKKGRPHMSRADDPGFSPTWLALRESADAAARAPHLLDRLLPDLAKVEKPVIHDLGCGTGSMGRWVAARLPAAQHWVLYDRDPVLLDHAVASLVAAADGSPVTVETRHRDITRLTAADLAGASLVTTSALLDVLTLEEVDRMAAACTEAGCPALLTLSVAGRVQLSPADPLDAEIGAAFDAHQRRSVDGRRLLGPDAAEAAAAAFARRGASVLLHPTPWRLGPQQAALIGEWLRGWVAAAVAQRPDLAADAEDYLHRRLAAAAAGELNVVVGHSDLLVR
jgi:glycosyltransferase involved in cell wall biosynthesis